ASLTKVMVTTPIVLSLVMEGSVDLDAPVGDYLAEWSGRDVTVRRLLSHTSGLAPYDFELAAAGLGRERTMAAVLAHPVQGTEVS
ncbi:serine hydrolase domain-containing protein, partial [Acinetobacter baumannii]